MDGRVQPGALRARVRDAARQRSDAAAARPAETQGELLLLLLLLQLLLLLLLLLLAGGVGWWNEMRRHGYFQIRASGHFRWGPEITRHWQAFEWACANKNV